MHLTYAFWQTWHLMDQTWHFCISTMAWQFWYPEFPGLLVVHDLPARCGSFPRGLLLPVRTLLSRATWTLRLRGLLARDRTLAICDFVDWRTGRPRFTEMAVTCDFVDWRQRATEIPAQRKNLARSALNKKRSRIKIVGSTILGNAKSKMPNTWRWTYFSFGRTFRDLANSNKWQISIA